VVGIGLAAVLAIGVYEFVGQDRQNRESQLALTAPASAMADASGQTAADAMAPDQTAATPAPIDQTATPSTAPQATSTVVAPAVSTTSRIAKGDGGTATGEESKPVKSRRSAGTDGQVAGTRNTDDTLATSVASAANPNANPSAGSASSDSGGVMTSKEPALVLSSSNTTSAATAGTAVNAEQAPAQTGQEAATGAGPAPTGNEPVASDSQITASVKSEIATAAPNIKVDVTTTNGVVALAGSVSSQDAVVQAREAAQRVAGVKYVDASALMVSNQ
jgi:hyperosmotically inducible protein